MSEPFVGEIRMFAGNFSPRGWAFCDGQLLAVSQNEALFSLLGTLYGGDGRTTFGLPDLRGRIPIHAGSGPGLSARKLGTKGGLEKVTLTEQQIPAHNHIQQGTSSDATSASPGNGLAAKSQSVAYSDFTSPVPMRSDSLASSGGSQSHDNNMPFLVIHFIIALFGIYPSRH